MKRFLVADTLYKRLCPSVGPSIDPSVHEHELKSRKVNAFDACVRLGDGLGQNGGWMPLPTHPQRYCDLASLVSFFFHFVCLRGIANDYFISESVC